MLLPRILIAPESWATLVAVCFLKTRMSWAHRTRAVLLLVRLHSRALADRHCDVPLKYKRSQPRKKRKQSRI